MGGGRNEFLIVLVVLALGSIANRDPKEKKMMTMVTRIDDACRQCVLMVIGLKYGIDTVSTVSGLVNDMEMVKKQV
jgi:hypothetical protein